MEKFFAKKKMYIVEQNRKKRKKKQFETTKGIKILLIDIQNKSEVN